MKPLTETVELHPIGSCVVGNIGNSELREILKEYFGTSDISYTADLNSKIWGEVMSYLTDKCDIVKDAELTHGTVIIYKTTEVNEYIVRWEWDEGRKNFVFWRKAAFTDDYHIYPNYRNYNAALHSKQFIGTYDEYLKQNITYGPTGPVGCKIE